MMPAVTRATARNTRTASCMRLSWSNGIAIALTRAAIRMSACVSLEGAAKMATR